MLYSKVSEILLHSSGQCRHFDCASCYRSIYPALRTWDACKEDEGGDEEADAEVQVDGGSRAFDGADQREGQDADEQAN